VTPSRARVEGVRALAANFDVFLLDVWGVIHDGERPFDGVLDAFERLASMQRRVILVSNTSRLRDAVIDTLTERMGIARDLFHDVVTSGEVTRAALSSRDPAVFATLPKEPRCYHFGDPDFVPWIFEVGLAFVDDVAEADLVIATAAVDDTEELAAAREHLAPAAARNVPLVCTNPDRVIPMAGKQRLGPGAVAEAYGGPKFLYGKPHAPIYEETRRRLVDVDPSRIIAIGDTLETDILGAQRVGYTSALVTGTGVQSSGSSTITPDFVLDRFAWSTARSK
jgi:HAD superfamily hydrolase (TIGR01459 family)